MDRARSMNVRRYKCKRHVALELRDARLWLVYDSENAQHLPILHKLDRTMAAAHARRMNQSGDVFYPGGEDQGQRDIRLAREHYLHTKPGFPIHAWALSTAHVAAAGRVTRDEAFKPRRALDLGP